MGLNCNLLGLNLEPNHCPKRVDGDTISACNALTPDVSRSREWNGIVVNQGAADISDHVACLTQILPTLLDGGTDEHRSKMLRQYWRGKSEWQSALRFVLMLLTIRSRNSLQVL